MLRFRSTLRSGGTLQGGVGSSPLSARHSARHNVHFYKYTVQPGANGCESCALDAAAGSGFNLSQMSAHNIFVVSSERYMQGVGRYPPIPHGRPIPAVSADLHTGQGVGRYPPIPHGRPIPAVSADLHTGQVSPGLTFWSTGALAEDSDSPDPRRTDAAATHGASCER